MNRVVWPVLFCIFIFSTSIRAKCVVVINEVNVDTPKSGDEQEFIELKIVSIAPRDKCIIDSTYTILIMKGLSKKGGAEVDF